MCFILASKIIRWQESSQPYFGGYIDKHVMSNIKTSEQQLPTSCSHNFWRVDQRSSARGFVCGTGNEVVSRANCVLNGKNDRQHQSLYQWNKFHLEFWNLVRSVANQFYQSFFRFENTPAFPIWYEVPSLKWKNGRACICLLLQPSRFKLNFHVKNQLKCKELLACNRSSSPNILKRFWTPGCVISRSDKNCQRGATAGDLKEVKEAERLRKCIAESMPAVINVVNICALSLHWWQHQQAEANIMPVLRP